MSQTRLPTTKDPLADLADLTIQPNIIPEDDEFDSEMLPEPVEETLTAEDVFGLDVEAGISTDKIVDNLPVSLETKEIEKKGKRGKDKKPGFWSFLVLQK